MSPSNRKVPRRPASARHGGSGSGETESRKNAGKGGSRSKRPASGGLFRGWLLNHLDIAIASLIRLLSTPFQTCLTALVIAIAIATPMLVFSFTQSIQASVSRLKTTSDISVYLDTRASVGEIDSVRAALEEITDIHAIEYISAEQGLADFQDRTGLNEILSGLEDNPIPAVMMISVAPELDRDLDALRKLAEELGQIDNVADVVFDYAWVERLQALINFMNRLVLVLAVLLGGGIALILGNTIRLEIENRREEIVIVKLVGATNAFVRRPLLYAGFWYGFLGGLLGWVLANSGVAALDQPLGDLSRLYVANFGLTFLDIRVLAVVVLLGAFFGLLGAWLAIGRHLSAIEPR